MDGSGNQISRYEYDPGNGNRTAVYGYIDGSPNLMAQASYDAQDRLESYGISSGPLGFNSVVFPFSTSFEYTANGELARRIVADTVVTRYSYDALGNLTGAHRPNGDNRSEEHTSELQS